MNFSENLKKQIDKNKIHKTDLAKAINVDKSTIGKYCSGARQPNLETLMKIADYFNITTDELLK